MEELWPSGVCLQGLASNRLKRHWLKPVVVSIEEKACREYARYGLRRRVQANHRSGVESPLDDIKTGGIGIPRDKSIGNPVYWVGGVRRKDGVISIQALQWNCGNSNDNAKGEDQVKKSKIESTEVSFEDGPICSSAEAPVMGVERRDRVVPADFPVNFVWRMNR